MTDFLTLIFILMPITIPLIVIGLVKLSDRNKNSSNYPNYLYYNNNQPYGYSDPGYNISDSNTAPEGFGSTPTPLPKSPQAPAEEAPLPESQKAEPVKPKNSKPDMTVSNILFLIGTVFVVLSGLAFGVASWVNTTHTGRVLIIAAAAVIAYILSCVVSKSLKLSGTSMSFYVLGTGFVSTALLTAGYYQIMGKWFSFDGDGAFALLAFSSIIAAALMFIGAKLFRNIVLVYTSLSAAALAFLFTILQAADTYASRSFLFAAAQIVITAFIYLAAPLKGSKYEAPVKNVGTVTAIIFGSSALSYVITTLSGPTFASYFIIAAAVIQFAFYGIYKKISALIGIESVLSLILSLMIYVSLSNAYSDKLSIIAFSLITMIVYFIHRFVPDLKNKFAELITFLSVMFTTFLCIGMIRTNSFVPYLMIAAIASVIVDSYLFSSDPTVKILAGLFTPVIPVSAVMTISRYYIVSQEYYINNIICMSILAGLLIGFAAVILCTPFGKKIKSEAAVYSNLGLAGMILISTQQYKLFTLITAALCLIHFALSNKSKFNITAALSSLALIKITYLMASEYSEDSIVPEIAMFITVIVYAVLSRIIYPEAIICDKGSKKVVDPLITVAIVPVFKVFGVTDLSVFLGLIACAIFCTGLVKKNFSDKAVSVLLTLSTAFTVIALIERPFFIFESRAVTNKITLAMIALSGFAVRFIWRKFENIAKNFSQIIFIFTFVSLLVDAIVFDTAENTIFVMAVMMIVLLASIVSRSKTWFITSAASLFTITLFATRDYLMALNWWIYLFLAGVILIGLAAANEYLKKNNETLKTSVAKKFSGWTW